jgi:DNA-binding winged helix-turn-helix (wHTH) protein
MDNLANRESQHKYKNGSELVLFGYLIDDLFQLDIQGGTITKLSKKSSRYNEVIKLRATMMRLFIFLMGEADGKIISHYELLTQIWEDYGLIASHQRLSHVIARLKVKLALIGMPPDFITTVHGKGYTISGHSIIKLYRSVK